MRKVKIVCTMGTACSDIEKIREMASCGLDVARLNFSHGDYDSHAMMLAKIRKVESEIGRPIAAMLDTMGPEIRTGMLEGHAPVELKSGGKFTLTTKKIEGSSSCVSISYTDLPREVSPGTNIYIDDGAISLRVVSADETDIFCDIVDGGTLGERKGINVPGADLSVPTLTEKDEQDIRWAMDNDMDYIAVSFVRRREDIMDVRRVVEEHGGKSKRIRIMAKIETLQSVQNIDSIVALSDAVMVARGDLGVEMPTEVVPMVQKKIIDICRSAGKPVVVATQMLDSMMRNPRPTRAEATDVANAVLDGADAVMLSGETAGGKYPVQAVRTMENIVISTEREAVCRCGSVLPTRMKGGIADAVSHSAVGVAEDMKASAIISLTMSGRTAAMVSKYRPAAPIMAVTPLVSTWRALSLMWGVRPMLGEMCETSESSVDSAIEMLRDASCVSEGDTVVFTAGFPAYLKGSTNMLLVQTVGRTLYRAPSLVKRRVVGQVHTARSSSEAIAKMSDGGILVVASTDASYMPAMKSAAAIVAEEPGIANFTAMTALQLGIPCMTGIEGALDKLRDGMFITVDGTVGAIYEGRVSPEHRGH